MEFVYFLQRENDLFEGCRLILIIITTTATAAIHQKADLFAVKPLNIIQLMALLGKVLRTPGSKRSVENEVMLSGSSPMAG